MIEKILPQRLNRNKLIGIIAPADPVVGTCSQEVINRAYSYLESKGFSILQGESVKISTSKHTAGSADLRVSDINNFIKREDVCCIMSFWGGFNTNELLNKIDYELIKNNPKVFIGFSDVTALTTAITKKTGLVTFSGPSVISFGKPEPFEYTWDYFEKMCINPLKEVRIDPSNEYADDLYFLRKDNDHRIRKNNSGIHIFSHGEASGEVLVGHLQTLLLLQGTEYFPDLDGKILFLEEDESSTIAHVARFLCQCKQSGWFDKVAGVVFGRFTESTGFCANNPLEDLLSDYFSNINFPVMYNIDFGHTDPLITIPNGGRVKLNTYKKEIIFDQSVI